MGMIKPMAAEFQSIARTRVLVRDVMNSPVITARPEEDIRTLSEKMSRAGVGSVIIVDQDLPVGIITDGDIVSKIVSKDLVPSRKIAKEIMSTPLRMIESEKEIIVAAREMRSARIKRLGVSYKNKLLGIISMSDIVSVTPELFDIISEKTRILTTEGTRRPSYFAGYCDQCGNWSDGLLEIDNRFYCEECRTDGSTRESNIESALEESSSD